MHCIHLERKKYESTEEVIIADGNIKVELYDHESRVWKTLNSH